MTCFKGANIFLGPALMFIIGLALLFVHPIFVILVCVAPFVFCCSLEEAKNEKRDTEYRLYNAFYQRVGGGVLIRNPDRVSRMWWALTPAGRDSIQTHQHFLADERILFPVPRK